MSEILILK